MDRMALRVANLLVGNDEGAAVLECTLVGPTVRFDEHTLIALTGGDLAVTAGAVPLPLWRPICVPAGTMVSAMAAVRGCRGTSVSPAASTYRWCSAAGARMSARR